MCEEIFFSSIFTFCDQIKTQSKKHFCCCVCNTLPTTSKTNNSHNFYNKNLKVEKETIDKEAKTLGHDNESFFNEKEALDIKNYKKQNNFGTIFFNFQNLFYKINQKKEKNSQNFEKKIEKQECNLPSISIALVSNDFDLFFDYNCEENKTDSNSNLKINKKDSKKTKDRLQHLNISLYQNNQNRLNEIFSEKLDSGIDSISNVSSVSRSELISNLSIKTDLNSDYNKKNVTNNKKNDYFLHIPSNSQQSSSISSLNTVEDCLTSQKLSSSDFTNKNFLSINKDTFLNSSDFSQDDKNSVNKAIINNLENKTNSFNQIFKSSLLQVSIDTMAITAMPVNSWLKKRLENWIQLSGHEGTIVPISNDSLWKKQPKGNSTEAIAYAEIMCDPSLDGFTPKFFKEIIYQNESFIEIQDLLSKFPDVLSRAIMDIKIGTRTFLESEVLNTTKRPDLYQKMLEIAPNELTSQEKADKAITKLRYMQFREKESSTALFGFRFEAAQLPGKKLQKCFKKIRTEVQILDTFSQFFDNQKLEIRFELIERLKTIRKGIECSIFFKTHEVVGSSLLIIYDNTRIGAWMIDFAKSSKVPNNLILNHRTKWEFGNHEDGYLTGLDNLIEILQKSTVKAEIKN